MRLDKTIISDELCKNVYQKTMYEVNLQRKTKKLRKHKNNFLTENHANSHTMQNCAITKKLNIKPSLIDSIVL